MRSVLHALVWETVRYSAWLQLMLMATCLIPAIVYASILSLVPSGSSLGAHAIGTVLSDTIDPVMFLLEVSMLSFVIFILVMAAGVSHANFALLATKPISNLSIVAWNTLSGSTVLAIQTSLIVFLYNYRFHTTWPLGGTVLFSIAIWFAAQPFFYLAGKSVLGALVTMLPIALMIGWFITRYKPIGGGMRDWDEIDLSESLQLLAVIAIFSWLSMRCVALARSNEKLTFPDSFGRWLRSLLTSLGDRTTSSAPFRSPARALFWYQWRWRGWQLSLCMLVLLAFILPTEIASLTSPSGWATAITSAYIGTIAPGLILGMLNGFQLENLQFSLGPSRAGGRTFNLDEIGSYQATRPVTDCDLARGQLWACLANVGLLVGLWLLLMSPVMLLAASQGQLAQLLPRNPTWSAVPLTALGLWIAMSNCQALLSAGRTKLFVSLLFVAMMTFVIISTWLQWTNNRELQMRVIQVAWSLLASGLVVFTLLAFARAYQRHMLDQRQIIVLILVSAAVIGVGVWSVQPMTFDRAVAVLCAGLLCTLPWATTPLAISWNRHR